MSAQNLVSWLPFDKIKNAAKTWRYENPGKAELLNTSGTTLTVDESKSVTGTAFYGSTTQTDNFSTPAGVKEVWLKFDMYIDSATASGNRFSFGHYSSALGGYVGIWNGIGNFSAWDSPDKFLIDATPTTAIDTNVKGTRGAINHVTLHMLSDATNGLIELVVNGSTYTYTGNVNNGADFDTLYFYSNTANILFSNVIVSDSAIQAGEGWQIFSFDVERKLSNNVEFFFDVERKFRWRYVNAGDADDLIIATTFLTDLPATMSQTGNAFYQTTRAKCFDLPATNEIWIKFDVYFDGSNRWRAYNGGSNGMTGITAQTQLNISVFSNDTNVAPSNSTLNNLCKKNQLQTVLLHMVSGSSAGVVEAWVDGNFIYRYTGDVNHGQAFEDIYLQSDGSGTFFSNVIISNFEIGLGEGYHLIFFDTERSVQNVVEETFDVERRVKNTIAFEFTADIERKLLLPLSLDLDVACDIRKSLEFSLDLEIFQVIPVEVFVDLTRNILTTLKLYPTDTSQYFLRRRSNSLVPIVIPTMDVIPPATDGVPVVQSMEISFSEQQITDQVKVVTVMPLDIMFPVQGQFLDYICDMRVEKVQRNGILYSIDCCSDLDEILYTPLNYSLPSTKMSVLYKSKKSAQEIFHIYPRASKHVEKIAAAMGLQAVMQFKDFYSTIEVGEREEDGATYNDLIRDIFGWSARIPTEMINVYIRNGKLFVIQRGYESNLIDISNSDHTSPVVVHELLRMFYQRSKWSKTLTYERKGARKNYECEFGESEEPEEPDDDDSEAAWTNIGQITVEDSEGITITYYTYTKDGVLLKTVANFSSHTDSKKNTVTTTTNSYDLDGLLEETTSETRHPNEPEENTKTVTSYGYIELSDGRTFLATEVVEQYSMHNGRYELDDTRVVSKSPTGRGQGAASDNKGNVSASGNKGDDRPTPYQKYNSGYNSDSGNDDYETITEYQDIEGLSLIDTSFPIQDIGRDMIDYSIPWDKVNEGKISVQIDGLQVLPGTDVDAIDTALGSGRLRELTAEMKRLNRKTQETSTLSLYNFPHLIDFNDRILLDGIEYFLVSNTAKTTSRIFAEQALTLRRWF